VKSVSIKTIRLGLIGARGYVGSELIKLVQAHPHMKLAFVSSREREGQLLSDYESSAPSGMRYCNYSPQNALLHPVDVLVLALPNGLAASWANTFDAANSKSVLLDLSADYRFSPEWFYGLPELTRNNYKGQIRISNPGCYATAMQLAIAPMRAYLAGAVQCFGVSGYSGAGVTPSNNNNPELLNDNLIPYALLDHIHEREVAVHIGSEIHFMPHVAPHFRGLSITTNISLNQSLRLEQVETLYRDFYRDEQFVEIMTETPWLSTVANTPNAQIGGFSVSKDGRRLVVVSVLDNLLKGAASQAMQNINLAFGLPETIGIV
jgi:N-acetyl-gamma-glutamyl-phosphate reductase